MIGVRRQTIGSLIHGAKTLSIQTLSNSFMADLKPAIAQITHDPWPAITALTALVDRCHLCIQRRIGYRTFTRFPLPPLAVSGSRNLQLTAHSGHSELVAVSFDPGVFHRDSFAKYAAAFFTISKSSCVLSSSRRSREFSASTSASDLFTGFAPLEASNFPARLRLIQFLRLPSGTPNRLAASLTPTVSPKRIASTLNSFVYFR